MAQRISINPVTRINGHWGIDVMLEGGKVVDAYSSCTYFRGLEIILKDRHPEDAPYYTQRICGICSTAHGLTSSLALEDAFGIEVPRNAKLLRNLIFGADQLQNHIRQFYFLSVPDYIRGPNQPPFVPRYEGDLRIPKEVEEKIFENYMRAIDMSRYAHELVTIFGGKAPHTHGIVIGGASVPPDGDKARMFLSMLDEIHGFIEKSYIPDLEEIAKYYPEYYELGKGYGNMFSLGQFLDPDGKGPYNKGGTVMNNRVDYQFDMGFIKEHLRYAWYDEEKAEHPVKDSAPKPNIDKEKAYSWSKAPRYRDEVFETNPLARLWISGSYRRGISVLDRHMARALEALETAQLMKRWLKELEIGKPIYTPWEMPKDAEGFGSIEAMRGGLIHYVQVKNKRIEKYQVITPSTWTMSPRDNKGRRGALEEALIGTPVQDPDNPIEIGRVARCFDPCSSCAVQVFKPNGEVKKIQLL